MTREEIQSEIDSIRHSTIAKTSDRKLHHMEYLSEYRHHQFQGSQPTPLVPYNSHKNRLCKLTPDMVREIRRKYIANMYGKKRLAQEYNVSTSVIFRIVKNKSWRNIKIEEGNE